MSVLANSYGSAANVAALTPRYANSGAFDATTRPTLVQVETWINQVSGLVNMLLAESGFTIPVTQADSVLMLAGLVSSACTDKVEYANHSGRFMSATAIDHGISIEKVLRQEISDWINAHAKGLENLGAARAQESGAEIGFRDHDNAGDEVVPLFQRKAFGERTQDWDT